jgi:hypothetical protein
MAAGEQVSAEAATGYVRVGHAARTLYQLRAALAAHDRSARPGALAARRIRRAERRAQDALIRAGFADPAIAAAVLRQVQVLTMTTVLARLDYRTADAAQEAIANLIASPGAAADREPATQVNGHPMPSRPEAATDAGDRDALLLAAATRIVAGAVREGGQLSQAVLAARLRREGYTVANNRLRWLSAASGLQSCHAEPDSRSSGGR